MDFQHIHSLDQLVKIRPQNIPCPLVHLVHLFQLIRPRRTGGDHQDRLFFLHGLFHEPVSGVGGEGGTEDEKLRGIRNEIETGRQL